MQTEAWRVATASRKYSTRNMYKSLQGDKSNVPWKQLFFYDRARPRFIFILWLACRNRLRTKNRLLKIGVSNNRKCCYCGENESCQHLFFECKGTRTVWNHTLRWMKIDHNPKGWQTEQEWIYHMVKRKNCQSKILKIAIVEMVYTVWIARNHKIFSVNSGKELVSQEIIQNIRWRIECNAKLAAHCNRIYE